MRDAIPLGRPARMALILAGIILVPAAFPIGYIAAVISGGGHGSPFDGDWVEAVWGVAMLATFPLLIALGIACLAATTRRRLWIAGVVALAIPVDVMVAVAALWEMNRPDPPVTAVVPQQLPMTISTTATPAQGPTMVSIACSAQTGECVTRTAGGNSSATVTANSTSPAKP